jgi:8-oxo-dGTP pyrophosphatase MutT (NUDIX family)
VTAAGTGAGETDTVAAREVEAAVPVRDAATVVPVRDAATVALLRDAGGAVEVWLLTRVEKMAFAAGMSVFAGGRVDPSDAELPWAGRSAALFAADFGCDDTTARGLVGAAVRECFEETGVLLCVPPASLAHRQAEVESRTTGFGALLAEHGLSIDASAVRAWGRWITPVGERRRYDTRFFVAALPAGARAADLTTESSRADWIRPADALAAHAEGSMTMLPPTLDTLASLAGFSTVAEVLDAAATRSLDPVLPVLHADGDGFRVELPDGRGYPLARLP